MENKKPFIITIVVFILIILGLTGFIVYDKFISKSEDSNYETVINDVSVDVNGLLKVSDILNTLDNAYNNETSNYYGYIYKLKTVSSKDYDIKAAIYAVIYNNMIRSNTEQTISSDLVKSQVKSIFGSILKYTPSEIKVSENNTISYNESNKTYTYKTNIPTKNLSKYYVRNVKTRLNESSVVVTRKMFYAEVSDSKVMIYKDASKANKVGEVSLRNGEIDTKEVIAKCGSKLYSYEYTFRYDLGEYYLSKIEKVN